MTSAPSEAMIDWEKHEYREWSVFSDELENTVSRYFGCVEKTEDSSQLVPTGIIRRIHGESFVNHHNFEELTYHEGVKNGFERTVRFKSA